MKKLLSLLLVLVLCFSLAACSKKQEEADKDSGNAGSSGVSSSAVGGAVDTVVGVYDALSSSLGQASGAASMEMSIELSDDLLDMLKQVMGATAETDVDLNWLNNVTVGIDTAVKDDLMNVVMKLGLGGTQIVSMDVIADMKNGKAFVGIPELSDKYVGMTMDVDEFGTGTELLQGLADALPDSQTVSKLLEKYIGIVLDNITLPEKQSVELTASGVTQSVSKQELVITEKLGATIGVAVLTELKNDNDVKTVLDNLFKAYADEDLYSAFVESIDEVLNSLSVDEASEEAVGRVILYTSGNELIGFEVYDGTEIAVISCLAPTSGDKTGVKLAFGSGSDTVEINGSGTRAGDKLNGVYTVSMGGKTYFTVKLIDFVSGNTTSGKIQLWPEDAFYNALDSQTKSLFSVIDLGVELVLNSGSGTDTISINILNGTSTFAGITLKVKSGGTASVTAPSNSQVIDVNDTDALESWMTSWNFDSVVSNLRKGGLPSEWLTLVESLFSGSALTNSSNHFAL